MRNMQLPFDHIALGFHGMAHSLRRSAASLHQSGVAHRGVAVAWWERCGATMAMARAFSKEGGDGDGDSVEPSRRVSWNMGMVPMAEGEAERGHDRASTLWPGMYHSPVTAALWQARASIRERDGRHGAGESPGELMSRTPAMSRTSVSYNLADDALLREQYRNPWNGCRIGKVLEDLDALAGTIAMKHCSDDNHTTRPLLLVTASVDKISMKKPLSVEKDLMMSGAVAWVGRSSMQIRMEILQSNDGGKATEEDVALVANFTFVARDSETKKAAPVNQLVPETEEEKRLFAQAEAGNEHKKWQRLQGNTDTSKVAVDMRRLKAILSEGRILCDMPALADPDVVLIRHTRLENAIICQPQQRNMHGRIFGGFLMRRAFELAFSTCYVFGGGRPLFLEIDHVDFRKPVDVGNLLRFKSCVLYTEVENPRRPLIHIEVVANVTQPEKRSSEVEMASHAGQSGKEKGNNANAVPFVPELALALLSFLFPFCPACVAKLVPTPESRRKVSNTFHFTFTLDSQILRTRNMSVRRVLPETEEEARGYLARYDADHMVSHPAFT